MADSEDYGLSSGDEGDLLQLDLTSLTSKRKADSDLHDDDHVEPHYSAKRARTGCTDSDARRIANRVLKERFGLEAFRLQQEAAIARLLCGDSAVVVFPTGGGKSLVYQVPALCFKELDEEFSTRPQGEGGITLVVSPLIALMKDQVDALLRRGISAAVLDSTKSKEEYFATIDAMNNGTLDILYCAPERLNNEGFVAKITNVRGGVRLLAVDEAHCISEWGHAFRPDYLKVARFAKEISAERVVCLTATATPQVAQDVCKAFSIPKEGLYRTTVYRSNLRLHARSYQTKAESYPKLRAFLKTHPGSTIVYATTREQVEQLAGELANSGLKTRHFHAGMKPQEKAQCQEEFMRSPDLIMVATIAFGMGIDKANIRNVIHYDIPRSLEGYSQEIGRAGRDGLESHCMLYMCAEDLHLRESFARGDLPSRKSIVDLLEGVFTSQPSSQDQCIEANHYLLSKTHDIKPTTLGIIFAQLELRFGVLRATTPKYTKYSYKDLKPTFWDKSPEAVALRIGSAKSRVFTHVDLDAATQASRIPRMALVSKLNAWNEEGYIELQTGGVVNMYRTAQQWPPTSDEQTRIKDTLYKELEVREQQDLRRMWDVQDLIHGTECFARSLASHFGDALPSNAMECGHCTWCEEHKAVPRVLPPRREWDSSAYFALLKAVPDRDDPRYLARIAFGIASPRVTAAKLGSGTKSVFGSMCDHDFMTLLRAFTKACEDAPARAAQGLAPGDSSWVDYSQRVKSKRSAFPTGHKKTHKRS